MTQVVGRAAAGALAGVLLWAAVAKVRRRPATVASFRGLGMPAPAALATAVPLAEVVVAAWLVLRPAVGGWVALALLGGFTAVLARAVMAGTGAACACFGSTSGRAVSGRDVVRNAVLAGLAIMATGAGRGPAL